MNDLLRLSIRENSTFDFDYFSGGLPKKDVIGSYFVDFVTTDKKITEKVLDKVIDSSLANQLSYKTLMARKNDTINIEWWFSKVTNESGITEIQGFGIDISEKEEAIRQAEFLKRYDPLTGFLNTDEFFIAFNNTLNKNKMAIIYLDFNHYNLINNKYGFDSGNAILIEASKRLKMCLKQPALLCRPNRASFIIALEIKDLNESTIFAESILNCLTGLYLISNEEIRLNAKIGVSIYPKDSSLINNSIRKAESVLSKAKFSKNNIAYYDKKFNTSLQRQLDVEQRLLVALESNLLQVFLQPKVNLITRTVVGYEALLRWEDPVLGSISPAEFIKVAEEMALAIHIDRYVIKTVFMSIRRCLDKGLSILPIAVNITSSHFAEASLVEYIISESEALDVDLNYLDLEVTEGVLLEVNEQVDRNLDILRAKSVKISIDDFGTGYSSLSYLRKLSVDAIKIDKSFVDDLFDDVGHQLVLAIVTIAKAVHLDVIVEGIETEEQLELLVKLGCITGQGYLFAKPQFICDVLSMQISDFKKDSLKLKNLNL